MTIDVLDWVESQLGSKQILVKTKTLVGGYQVVDYVLDIDGEEFAIVQLDFDPGVKTVGREEELDAMVEGQIRSKLSASALEQREKAKAQAAAAGVAYVEPEA